MSDRKRGRRFLAMTVSTLLASAGIAGVGAVAANAAEVEADPAETTLSWGIKNSFLNYINGPIANGSVTVSGNIVDNSAPFQFTSGTGTVDPDAQAANITFDGTVHFEGHDYGDGAILDLAFSNIRVDTSAGTLYADVEGREFVDTSTLGPWFSHEDVALAQLADTSWDGNTFTAGSATITETGADAFGGFYSPGSEMDGLSLTVVPQEAPEEPIWDPQLTVSPSTDLDPEGQTVTVNGSGYNPDQAIYVFLCADIDLPTNLFQHALGCTAGSQQLTPDADGAFEIDFDVSQLDEAPTSVFTTANHTAMADRTLDAKATLEFADAVEEPEPQTPSVSLDVTEVPEERVDIEITGTGFGDVQALPGQTEPHAYFTVVEQGSDLSNVGESDTAISAAIDEDGDLSDVLSVPAEELDQTAEYEVISWPSRSFPTEENLFTRDDVAIDWATLFPEDVTDPDPTAPEEPTEPKVPDTAADEWQLIWGVKESFKNYVTGPIAGGDITVDGAEHVGGQFVWTDGEVIEESNPTEVQFSGSVTFSGHSGILHVEISNPRVVVNADGSGSIFADVESKEFIDTVTEGEIIEYPNVELVTFDSGVWGGNAGGAGSGSASLQSVTPFATQATTDESFVSDITELTADGAPAFGGFYSAGEEFDGFTLNSAEQDVTNPDSNNGNNNNNAGNNNESSNNAGGNVNGGDQENCVAYEVSGSLDWGLKESFRNYIEGGIAKGAINTSGIEHSDDGFRWSGSGQLNTDAMLGEVSMPGTLHFTGHDGVLDTKISNVRLVIHSSSQGSIYADVVSNDMEGNAHDLTGVRFANVNVSGASLTSDSFSVSGAATTLTDDGAKAFAGFYEAGIELDPVSFSLTLGNEVPCNDAVNPSGEGLAQTGFESPALALIAFALALAALGARGVAVAQRRRS